MLSKSLSNGSLKVLPLLERRPGFRAKNVKEFWHNLTHGIESLSTFSDEDLIESGVDVGSIRNDSNFAKVNSVLSWKMS